MVGTETPRRIPSRTGVPRITWTNHQLSIPHLDFIRATTTHLNFSGSLSFDISHHTRRQARVWHVGTLLDELLSCTIRDGKSLSFRDGHYFVHYGVAKRKCKVRGLEERASLEQSRCGESVPAAVPNDLDPSLALDILGNSTITTTGLQEAHQSLKLLVFLFPIPAFSVVNADSKTFAVELFNAIVVGKSLTTRPDDGGDDGVVGEGFVERNFSSDTVLQEDN